MDAKQLFETYRNRFAALYQAVLEGHKNAERPHRGHGLDHDVTVAQLAATIAPDERTGEKAWVAALLHSTDRTVEKGNTTKVESFIGVYLKELPEGYFSNTEVEEIFVAVMRHTELNQGDQSLTQQVLMDADRLANLQAAVIIRAGQFQPTIPALELQYLDSINPQSTYHEPKSVIDDLRANIREYIPKLRLPQAISLGTKLGSRLQAYIDMVQDDYRSIGLDGVIL